MNIYLTPDQKAMIPGDLMLSVVFRTDLVPIPRSVELLVRAQGDMEKNLAEGKVIYGGYEMLPYRIVNCNRVVTAKVQNGSMMAALKVIALLDSCAQISYRLPKAVIKENVTFSEIYLACGATTKIASDFSVSRFSCFRGMIPTYPIAQIMQEEGAVLALRNGALTMLRVPDLFKQQPKDAIGLVDSTDQIGSEYMARHEIPSFFSVDPSGDFVMGNFSVPRAVAYQPVADERVLNNMSRVLMTSHKMDSDIAQHIVAGDLLVITGKPLVVITSANWFYNNEGITETSSRFWLGEIAP